MTTHVAALTFRWGTLDPRRAVNGGVVTLLSHTHDTVTELHPETRECQPGVLTQLPVPADDHSYRLTLRNGLRFSDGTPVTAQDLAVAIDETASDPVSSVVAGHLGATHSTSVRGDDVTVLSHLSPQVLAARLALVRLRPQRLAGSPDASIGSGPYRLVELDDGVVRLAAREATSSPRHAITEQLELHGVVDGQIRSAGLLDGWFHAVEDPTPEVGRHALTRAGTIRFTSAPSANTAWLLFNCQAAFADAGPRRALSAALDRGSIAAASEETITGTRELVPAGGDGYEAAFVPVPPPSGVLPEQELRMFISDASWLQPLAREVVRQLRNLGLRLVITTGVDGRVLRRTRAAGRVQRRVLLRRSERPARRPGLRSPLVPHWSLGPRLRPLVDPSGGPPPRPARRRGRQPNPERRRGGRGPRGATARGADRAPGQPEPTHRLAGGAARVPPPPTAGLALVRNVGPPVPPAAARPDSPAAPTARHHHPKDLP